MSHIIIFSCDTIARIYSKVFITMEIYKTFVHSSGKNGRHVKSEKKIIQFFEHKVIIHYTANPGNVGRMPNRLVSQVPDNPTMNENRPSSMVGPRVRTPDLSGLGSLPPSLRFTAALAPGNRTSFEFIMSQPSFPCNRTILIAIKDCSVTRR
jgi:hypothetical protein